MNKSIDGTADDEEEGVPTDEAIRAGLELLKVRPDTEALLNLFWNNRSEGSSATSLAAFSPVTQVLSFTHPVSFHSAETFESLLGCLKMDDEKVAEAALQIFRNTGSKMEESFPHIKSYVWPPPPTSSLTARQSCCTL